MCQGAFLVYAIGVVSGIVSILFEVYVVGKKIKKESKFQNNDNEKGNDQIIILWGILRKGENLSSTQAEPGQAIQSAVA